RVLLDALPEGVLTLGAQVTALDQDAKGVAIELADGQRRFADAVVAADGIRSPMRQQLVGTDEPEFSGTVVYRGLVPREDAPDLHPEPVNRYWLGPYRHGVVYWISAGTVLAVNSAVQHAGGPRGGRAGRGRVGARAVRAGAHGEGDGAPAVVEQGRNRVLPPGRRRAKATRHRVRDVA